jgi:decaprenylphospho-beta-D-ribofuranose 2-oxidase
VGEPKGKKFFGWSQTKYGISEYSDVNKYKQKIGQQVVSRGSGLSYGDAALNSQNAIIYGSFKNSLKSFAYNKTSKSVLVAGNVTVSEVVNCLAEFDRTLLVVPGTSRATIAGCIAMNVHGKNHFSAGGFGDQVESFELFNPIIGSFINCSRQMNSDLFDSTIGGLGLTGHITEVELKTAPLKARAHLAQKEFSNFGYVIENIEKIRRESENFIALMNWNGKNLGSGYANQYRSVDGKFSRISTPKNLLPIKFPFINKTSIKVYNSLFFNNTRDLREVDYFKLCFMADQHKNANLWFGKNGFIEYQFALPDQRLEDAFRIAKKLSLENTIYLSGIKLLSKSVNGLLSFPIEGFTMTLTMKPTKDLLRSLSEIDEHILEIGGKIYLAKDDRLSPRVFKQMYPEVSTFQSIRQKYNLNGISSDLSRRLQI